MNFAGELAGALTAPRRALWSALGLPEHGEDLVANMGLADRGSVLAKALGLTSEVALDPLTYLGGAVGGAAGGLLGGLGEEAAAVAPEEIAALTTARRAAQEGIVNEAQAGADTLAEQQARFAGMRGSIDPDSLAEADYKAYKSASPGAVDKLESAGVGTGNGEGGATIYGARKPEGVDVKALGAGGGNKALRGRGLEANALGAPEVSPYERYLLMHESVDARAGGLPVASVHNPADPLADVAARRAAEINGARQTPTLEEAMLSRFDPLAHVEAMRRAGLAGLPVHQAFDQAQGMLARALAQGGGGGLTNLDRAMVGAAGGATFGAGGDVMGAMG